MTLGQKQRKFTRLVAMLIEYAYLKGYELSFGDAYANRGHKVGSLHYSRLAIDLNLFLDGKYLRSTEAHLFLGEFWESLDDQCVWGGRFRNKDGNHYQFGKG